MLLRQMGDPLGESAAALRFALLREAGCAVPGPGPTEEGKGMNMRSFAIEPRFLAKQSAITVCIGLESCCMPQIDLSPTTRSPELQRQTVNPTA